jgi:hypothetical protein
MTSAITISHNQYGILLYPNPIHLTLFPYLRSMGSTRGPYNDTPSPPEVMSKSTNISQSETKLTDSGSHATSGPTRQGELSYVSTAGDDLSFGPTFHREYFDYDYGGCPQAEIRFGPPLEYGPPPPGLRSGLSKKKEKEDAHRENRLKDSANAYRNPTTRYAPEVMQYPKATPEGSVQRTHSSFHEHDSSAPRLLDTGDSRLEEGSFLNSAPPSDRRETPITPPSALLPTQNQRKPVIGVTNINSTVPSTPWPLPQGGPQTLATSSYTCKSSIVSMSLFVSPIVHPAPAMFNILSNPEKGGESQAYGLYDLYPPELQHFLEQPTATVPVTAQPTPRELHYPLAREDRQGEGLGVQPTSLDIRNLGLQTQSPEERSSFCCCC